MTNTVTQIPPDVEIPVITLDCRMADLFAGAKTISPTPEEADAMGLTILYDWPTHPTA